MATRTTKHPKKKVEKVGPSGADLGTMIVTTNNKIADFTDRARAITSTMPTSVEAEGDIETTKKFILPVMKDAQNVIGEVAAFLVGVAEGGIANSAGRSPEEIRRFNMRTARMLSDMAAFITNQGNRIQAEVAEFNLAQILAGKKPVFETVEDSEEE